MHRFSARLLAWYDRYGRKHLPWVNNADVYQIWLSEVMLQQTRVDTVLPYFQRFIVRFPTVQVLAAATLDEVLRYWAGLGYYARARNLHAAARIVIERHGSQFPQQLDAWMALPGIGRSTAGAILCKAFHMRAPILDGNVKRVLARYFAVAGWPGEPAVERQLWALSEQVTPHHRVADYTQAVMDLGASLCSRKRPACTLCPLSGECAAHAQGRTAELPAARPAKTQPRRNAYWLVVRNCEGAVYLEHRPPVGLWGGLWTFPEFATLGDMRARLYGLYYPISNLPDLVMSPMRKHVFTHFDLYYTPVVVQLDHREFPPSAVAEQLPAHWYRPGGEVPVGLPTPVQKLIDDLFELEESTYDPHCEMRKTRR